MNVKEFEFHWWFVVSAIQLALSMYFFFLHEDILFGFLGLLGSFLAISRAYQVHKKKKNGELKNE